ncbi:MAG TPA: multidrug resistance efflux transporter family protein [Chloroflexi bacterium]|nr:multidrug resistance efflux transporter family protein [Chloroflexota bacterium]
MFRLLSTGLLAALFFSSTFILNRAMSLEGGHWVWSAALRYVWMTAFLIVGPLIIGRGRLLVATLRLLRAYWRFWLVAGTVGFGVFYAGVTFAASFAPGWVVATTWQITVLASPLVLLAYGRRVPLRGVVFTVLIFLGIVFVNVGQVGAADWGVVLWGAAPVLVAAFAYPAGLQMVWEARAGGHARLPHIVDPVLGDSFARVLLLTLGSLPFWLIVILLVQPPPPTSGQWVSTALVALFSGVIATSLFVYARHQARTAYELAAVDATQAGEVLFALVGEVLLLGGALPDLFAVVGIALTILGLVLYLLAQGKR